MTYQNCNVENDDSPNNKISFRDALLNGLHPFTSLPSEFACAEPKIKIPPIVNTTIPRRTKRCSHSRRKSIKRRLMRNKSQRRHIFTRRQLRNIARRQKLNMLRNNPKEVRQDPYLQFGENGCMEYTNEGLDSPVLALSQMVRGGNPQAITKQILEKGKLAEIVDLITLVFATRNTRGGKGEKKLSYDMFLTLWMYYPKTAQNLLELFVHYGYWKDLFLLMEYSRNLSFANELKSKAMGLIIEQYKLDEKAIKDFKSNNEQQLQEERQQEDDNMDGQEKEEHVPGPKLSLLAKWLPRERHSLDKKLSFVNALVEILHSNNDNDKNENDNNNDNNNDIQSNNNVVIENKWKSYAKSTYRKQVTQMTKYLDLPEVALSARRADEIKIGRLASKATNLLTRALLNESKSNKSKTDPKRKILRENFISYISKKGLKGGQVLPHEIVKTILYENPSIDQQYAMQAQWKSIWSQVIEATKAKAEQDGYKFNPTKMVPICDVSGSMYGTPIEVCIALGIGISEITHEAFRDMVLTFSATPQWHRLDPSQSIFDKVKSLKMAQWGMNTNFAKAYDQILQVCIRHNLKREDVPVLICFSDMQFDQASCNDQPQLMFNVIKEKFKKTGKQLGWEDCDPTPIIFWNLRNTGGHPVSKSTEGAVLLSGFSPSLLQLVMNGEALKEDEIEIVEMDGTTHKEKIRVTPEQIMRKMLDDPIYDPVRNILAESNEGALVGYCYSSHQ